MKEHEVFGLSDEFLKIKPKTKLIVHFLKAIGLDKERVLFVLPKMQKNNLVLAARNLPKIALIDITSLNPYEVLKNSKVFIVEEGLQVLEKHFLKNEN